MNFKKILVVAAILLFALPLLQGIDVEADLNGTTFDDGSYEYEFINSTEVKVTGFAGTPSGEREVVLGKMVPYGDNEYPLVEIADYAFNFSKYESVTAINVSYIPESIKTIGTNAFEDCILTMDTNTHLDFFIIPDSVTTLKSSAFKNCVSQCSGLIIGNGIATIPEQCFSGDSLFDFACIGTNVSTISSSAFYGCSNLTDVYFYGSSTTVGNMTLGDSSFECGSGDMTFYSTNSTALSPKMTDGVRGTSPRLDMFNEKVVYNGYSANQSATFSFTTKTLTFTGTDDSTPGSGAFNIWLNVLNDIETVVLPENVKKIGNYSFFFAKHLSSINFENIEEIGDYSFVETALTDIDLPKCIAINQAAFRDCEKLVSVKTGNNLNSIGLTSFQKCENLSDFNFGSNLEQIGSGAFTDTGFEYLDLSEFTGSMGTRTFSNCENLVGVKFSQKAESVGGEFCFMGCVSLTSITIPASVTKINRGTFIGCFSVKEIHLECGSDVSFAQGSFTFGTIAHPTVTKVYSENNWAEEVMTPNLQNIFGLYTDVSFEDAPAPSHDSGDLSFMLFLIAIAMIVILIYWCARHPKK